ncbi:MAG: hypothetical protein DI598_08905 [Pseudopedobacter saltans]|uniref:Uncharacterized protein n=1 Tax=Pseudopedobacter saltans TaxID=151895 RepID=A0A2W5GT59_9SPHI|nr:MAG: hypothetical protein DI598_08905 [Pseudopedobacter saltans]
MTKNRVIKKLQIAFGQIAIKYQEVVEKGMPTWNPEGIKTPKISKGEQYEGLPYLMLDYPRMFSSNDTFAVRSFFWWGNYFSISLLLTGSSQTKLEQYLLNHPSLQTWHLDMSDTPWNHAWSEKQSPKLEDVNKQNYIPKDFFKLSKQIPLTHWQDMERFFEKEFQVLWAAITSYPNV